MPRLVGAWFDSDCQTSFCLYHSPVGASKLNIIFLAIDDTQLAELYQRLILPKTYFVLKSLSVTPWTVRTVQIINKGGAYYLGCPYHFHTCFQCARWWQTNNSHVYISSLSQATNSVNTFLNTLCITQNLCSNPATLRGMIVDICEIYPQSLSLRLAFQVLEHQFQLTVLWS